MVTVARSIDIVTTRLEVIPDQVGADLVVIRDQDPHRS
jgi:hypothetical protein